MLGVGYAASSRAKPFVNGLLGIRLSVGYEQITGANGLIDPLNFADQPNAVLLQCQLRNWHFPVPKEQVPSFRIEHRNLELSFPVCQFPVDTLRIGQSGPYTTLSRLYELMLSSIDCRRVKLSL